MAIKRIFVLFLAVLLFTYGAIFYAVPAIGTSSEEIREQIDELEQQEKALQQQIDALEAKRNENAQATKDLVEQKQILDEQIALLNSELLLKQEQLQHMKQLIADAQEEYEKAQAAYGALQEQNRKRIRVMEEEGSLSYWSVIFHASSFSDLLDRIHMIDEIANADRRHMQQLAEAAEKVSQSKASLEAQQTQLQDATDDLTRRSAELARKQTEAGSLLQQLNARKAEYDAMMDDAEQAQQALLEQIAKLEDEFDAAAYEEWLATQPVTPPQTTPPPVSAEGWICPVASYTLSSPFGMRLHPIYGEYRMHNGIDMGCPAMTPIYASRGGQVEIAQYSSTAGNYVQINHGDGYRSQYMHMTYYTVSRGQYVTAGQLIGYVGNTGASKGDHLHFGVSYNGTFINPYPLIS